MTNIYILFIISNIKHGSKHLTYINSFNPHNNTTMYANSISISQMMTLRHTERSSDLTKITKSADSQGPDSVPI